MWRVLWTPCRSVLTPLGEKADVRNAWFDRELTPLPGGQSPGSVLREFAPAPQGPTAAAADPPVTDITAALEQLRRTRQEQPLAAVFLLTDAAHNGPRAATRERPPRTCGHSGLRRADRQHATRPRYRAEGHQRSRRGDEGRRRGDRGHAAGVRLRRRTVRVELLRDGEVIQNAELQIDSPIAMPRVRFNTQLTEVGLQRFQVRVAPLDGEAERREQLRPVRGERHARTTSTCCWPTSCPAGSFATWPNSSAGMPRSSATSCCSARGCSPRAGGRKPRRRFRPRPMNGTSTTWCCWGTCRARTCRLPAQESLVEFIRERGGTLVIIAGDQYMPQGYVNQPLEELLPVTKVDETNAAASSDGYAFHVTEEGWRHDALMIADTQESTRHRLGLHQSQLAALLAFAVPPRPADRPHADRGRAAYAGRQTPSRRATHCFAGSLWAAAAWCISPVRKRIACGFCAEIGCTIASGGNCCAGPLPATSTREHSA